MFGGERYSIFIIDLIKAKLLLRFTIKNIIHKIHKLMPFWFINTTLGFGEHVYKYAILCGEPFCIYKWTNGCITNVKVLSS
jgi:ribosomal protein S2